MPDRLGRIGRFVQPSPWGLGDAECERIVRVLAVLTSSSALRMWRDHLGSSVDEAADDVLGVLCVLIEEASRRDGR
jgi:hypothetical protein